MAGKTYNNPSNDFTITVASNINSVEISAVANKGTVSGTGVKEITTGTNTFKISVSDGGKTTTYTVRVRKLAEENSTPNISDNKNNNTPTISQPINATNPDEPIDEVTEEEPKQLRLIYLTIDDVEMSPDFDSEIFEYWVTVTNRNDLSIVAAANDDDAQVEIEGNKELKERR